MKFEAEIKQLNREKALLREELSDLKWVSRAWLCLGRLCFCWFRVWVRNKLDLASRNMQSVAVMDAKKKNLKQREDERDQLSVWLCVCV
jgi:hypothetical protein